MPSKNRSWKNERASVHNADRRRPRSNKRSKSDTTPAADPGSRSRIWVGGYRRSDGTRVEGHYRAG